MEKEDIGTLIKKLEEIVATISSSFFINVPISSFSIC